MNIRDVDFALALALKAFLIVSSLVLLWRMWRKRDTADLSSGQLALLPPRWRRWVLGESKREKTPDA